MVFIIKTKNDQIQPIEAAFNKLNISFGKIPLPLIYHKNQEFVVIILSLRNNNQIKKKIT